MGFVVKSFKILWEYFYYALKSLVLSTIVFYVYFSLSFFSGIYIFLFPIANFFLYLLKIFVILILNNLSVCPNTSASDVISFPVCGFFFCDF